MADTQPFGVQTNGIEHAHDDPMPDIDAPFRMVRDAGVFDRVDETPEPHEMEPFARAGEKYAIPLRAAGWFYALGDHAAAFEHDLKVARRLGSRVHNAQVGTCSAEGAMITDGQTVDSRPVGLRPGGQGRRACVLRGAREPVPGRRPARGPAGARGAVSRDALVHDAGPLPRHLRDRQSPGAGDPGHPPAQLQRRADA